MSLSGSLSDFEISDIFHIISQERKTGKLILSTDDIEGNIVFKEGDIIFAGTNKQDLKSMLLKYLFYVKKYPENKINELTILCRDNFQLFLKELLKKLMTSKEQAIIIETGIEDMVCSFFHLKQGNFQFEPMSNVNFYRFGDFSISTDSITMEAAKRIDDWERISERIGKDSVFIRSENVVVDKKHNDNISALENFPHYLCSILDGTSSTEFLCQESFFSKYQVYSALYDLLSESKIIPLPDDISNSVNAALQKTDKPLGYQASRIIISILSTILIVLGMYIFGQVVLRDIVLSKSYNNRDRYQREIIQSQANLKIAIATLHYQAKFGAPPSSLNDLVRVKFLEKRDIANFNSTAYFIDHEEDSKN